MAYLKPIDNTCQWDSCPSHAVFRVHTRENMVVGRYCARHAAQKLKQVREQESPAPKGELCRSY